MRAYADTSFLASLYVPDVHSPAAAAAIARVAGPVTITPLVEVELRNAIQLRVFRGELSASQAHKATMAFDADLVDGVFDMQPFPASTYEKAKHLAHRYTPTFGTRSLDLLHVAAALVLDAKVLLTFDLSQRKLAQAVGFSVLPRSL